jgi:hypothetical protein
MLQFLLQILGLSASLSSVNGDCPDGELRAPAMVLVLEIPGWTSQEAYGTYHQDRPYPHHRNWAYSDHQKQHYSHESGVCGSLHSALADYHPELIKEDAMFEEREDSLLADPCAADRRQLDALERLLERRQLSARAFAEGRQVIHVRLPSLLLVKQHVPQSRFTANSARNHRRLRFYDAAFHARCMIKLDAQVRRLDDLFSRQLNLTWLVVGTPCPEEDVRFARLYGIDYLGEYPWIAFGASIRRPIYATEEYVHREPDLGRQFVEDVKARREWGMAAARLVFVSFDDLLHALHIWLRLLLPERTPISTRLKRLAVGDRKEVWQVVSGGDESKLALAHWRHPELPPLPHIDDVYAQLDRRQAKRARRRRQLTVSSWIMLFLIYSLYWVKRREGIMAFMYNVGHILGLGRWRQFASLVLAVEGVVYSVVVLWRHRQTTNPGQTAFYAWSLCAVSLLLDWSSGHSASAMLRPWGVSACVLLLSLFLVYRRPHHTGISPPHQAPLYAGRLFLDAYSGHLINICLVAIAGLRIAMPTVLNALITLYALVQVAHLMFLARSCRAHHTVHLGNWFAALTLLCAILQEDDHGLAMWALMGLQAALGAVSFPSSDLPVTWRRHVIVMWTLSNPGADPATFLLYAIVFALGEQVRLQRTKHSPSFIDYYSADMEIMLVICLCTCSLQLDYGRWLVMEGMARLLAKRFILRYCCGDDGREDERLASIPQNIRLQQIGKNQR